jgi:hypothetical protein
MDATKVQNLSHWLMLNHDTSKEMVQKKCIGVKYFLEWVVLLVWTRSLTILTNATDFKKSHCLWCLVIQSYSVICNFVTFGDPPIATIDSENEK